MPSKPPPPPPLPRQGPRPLPLHLAAASLAWMSSLAALPSLRNGSLGWRPELAASGSLLAAELAAADPEKLAAAVAREGERRFISFLDSIRSYRRHPFQRAAPTAPVLWQEGSTRLLDYRQSNGRKPGKRGRPIMIVPSLINRAYILDLLPERSFMTFLAGEGFRPFLVDWQSPGEVERRFDLGDYILGRLAGALDAVVGACGERPVLLGYCMGGDLALGLAHRRAGDLAGLALLATPWDFHAERPEQAAVLAALLPAFEPLLDSLGELPVDLLQALFAALGSQPGAAQIPGLCRPRPGLRAGAPVRSPGGLAERRGAAGSIRGPGMPGPMVWRECHRAWCMAAARPRRLAAAHQAPISGGDTGPGSHRAARLGPGPGQGPAGLRYSAGAHRPYRHDERRAGRGGCLAARGRMDCRSRDRGPAPFLHRNKATDKVET